MARKHRRNYTTLVISYRPLLIKTIVSLLAKAEVEIKEFFSKIFLIRFKNIFFKISLPVFAQVTVVSITRDVGGAGKGGGGGVSGYPFTWAV